MTMFNLTPHRAWLREDVYPAYQTLGALAFAYLQGSLVSGYTDTADLDVVMVWNQKSVPEGRAEIVASLDQSGHVPPFVVDYQDIHLERFTRAGQKYNIGHRTLADFRATIDLVRTGEGRVPAPILIPLVTVAGFIGGELLADPAAIGITMRELLHPFPEALRQSTSQDALRRQESLFCALQKSAAREDWLVFHTTLIEATRLVLPALFAVHRVYYPGDTWVGRAMERVGLPLAIRDVYARLWMQGATPAAQIAVLEALFAHIEGGSIR
jgi:Domain of unknown function (DUF4037)